MSVSPPVPLFLHDRFYYDDGNALLLVEGVLYNVHRSTLTRRSPWFARLFDQPDDTLPLGWYRQESAKGEEYYIQWEDRKIVHTRPRVRDEVTGAFVLHGVSVSQVDAFLSVLYPNDFRTFDADGQDTWVEILKLASVWECAPVRQLAMARLEDTLASAPVFMLELARTCRIEEWLRMALSALCTNPSLPTLHELHAMHVKDVALILALKLRCGGDSERVRAELDAHLDAEVAREEDARVQALAMEAERARILKEQEQEERERLIAATAATEDSVFDDGSQAEIIESPLPTATTASADATSPPSAYTSPMEAHINTAENFEFFPAPSRPQPLHSFSTMSLASASSHGTPRKTLSPIQSTAVSPTVTTSEPADMTSTVDGELQSPNTFQEGQGLDEGSVGAWTGSEFDKSGGLAIDTNSARGLSGGSPTTARPGVSSDGLPSATIADSSLSENSRPTENEQNDLASSGHLINRRPQSSSIRDSEQNEAVAPVDHSLATKDVPTHNILPQAILSEAQMSRSPTSSTTSVTDTRSRSHATEGRMDAFPREDSALRRPRIASTSSNASGAYLTPTERQASGSATPRSVPQTSPRSHADSIPPSAAEDAAASQPAPEPAGKAAAAPKPTNKRIKKKGFKRRATDPLFTPSIIAGQFA